MPNHCENDLYVRGAPEKVSELLQFVGAAGETPAFDCNAVIPYPEEFATRDADSRSMSRDDFAAKYGNNKDGFNNGGYEWCCENWGTKWGAYDVGVEVTRRGTRISFSSAWSPPTPVILALHARFPECPLTLEYFESGMGFKGGAKFDGGVQSDEWSADYRGRRGG